MGPKGTKSKNKVSKCEAEMSTRAVNGENRVVLVGLSLSCVKTTVSKCVTWWSLI